MEKLERIYFLSRADKLKPVRDVVRCIAIEQQCSADDIDHIVMAINEACMNIIQHAYNEKDDGEIILEFWKDNNELVTRIYDFAAKINKNEIQSRDLNDVRPGGLGVHMIHEVMDKVEYLDGQDGVGNLLEMRKVIASHNPDV